MWFIPTNIFLLYSTTCSRLLFLGNSSKMLKDIIIDTSPICFNANEAMVPNRDWQWDRNAFSVILLKLVNNSQKIQKILISNQHLEIEGRSQPNFDKLNVDLISLKIWMSLRSKFKHSKVFMLWFLNTNNLVKKNSTVPRIFQPDCL